MKKFIAILFFSVACLAYGQEKFALVIGNSSYTYFGTLKNPENDAIDMKDVLESLGFTVDIVLNGSLGQMENSAIRLRNRLSEAGNDAIGFFFFAGHGLEMNSVNYLIPSDANIPDRNFLRERAFSVQVMLDMLNDSRNALNIIVLDACRDFPAAWSRNLNRGLAVIANPPANHIIMYATGAGTVANDGTGRNGLFTGLLLNNLKQPGMDINEIFRRTMSDVSRASNNEQRPALYTDFAETVYFGSRPVTAQSSPPQTVQEQPAEQSEPAQPVQAQVKPPVQREPAGSNQSTKTGKAANARNNWILGELLLFPLGVGASYERMLNSKISLGTNVFWGTVSFMPTGWNQANGFGVDAFFHFYPLGKAFFLGVALGFHYVSVKYESDIHPELDIKNYAYYGFAITPELGWKIDVGQPGGLFLQIAGGMPFLFGKCTDPEEGLTSSALVGVGTRWVYFGMGYAF